MNVFDIIGPVMVGPSSSHTAGVVRIGRIATRLLGETPAEVTVKLHGSFAKTYRGHSTDKAVIAGLLDMDIDDIRIRESLDIARDRGIRFQFMPVNLKDVHPNTLSMEVTGISGKKVELTGASIGGGNIIITEINGLKVDFDGKLHTMVIPHKDVPGLIAAVTGVLGTDKSLNIAYMRVYRKERGGEAIMIIETDQRVDNTLCEKVRSLRWVHDVTVIEPIE
jgi:L-serine dehydratase